ncbi:hypothetical protein [Streptodolium elevatio]|uniref:Uncharacterized protein n=1 Tax=Streptodolium elevatio TaxID=3157996 RepID=A0ABV3D8Q3_9ACTN
MNQVLAGKAVEPASRTWYDFAQQYAALKWPFASANSRNSNSETLTAVTRTMATDRPGRPDPETLPCALRGRAFVPEERRAEMPAPIANALTWVADVSRPLADLSEAAVMRSVLDGLALKLDGTRAAAETVRRKRSVFYGPSDTPWS